MEGETDRQRQLIIDFTSPINERLAIIRSLEHLDLGLSPGRINGVIELLTRVVLMSRGPNLQARVAAIGSRSRDRPVRGEKTIRNWTRDAESLGVIAVDRPSERFGGHTPPTWTVLYPRIHELLRSSERLTNQGGNGAESGGKRGGNGAEMVTALGAEKITAPQVYRLGLRSRSFLSKKERGAESDGEEGNTSTRNTTGNPDHNQTANRQSYGATGSGAPTVSARNTDAPSEPADGDTLRGELVEDHPLLRASADRQVVALPPGDLVGNPFCVIKPHHLGNGNLLLWFRQQLGLRRPLTPPTVADALLVLGTGLWAAALTDAEVKKSRLAAFAHTILARRWDRSCSQLGNASRLLERLLGIYPHALTYTESISLGPKSEPVVTNHT